MSNTPLTSIDVIGHDWAVALLQRQVAAGRVAQSILLSGPPQVGKATLGRYLAQYLNCQAENKPCGQCGACRKTGQGHHPDVRLLDGTDPLKIDDIRTLQRDLSLSPYEGYYRVVLLANFERATTAAANALLKTLEEPAAQVVLILTAIDPGGLLPTIVSRCQVVALRPLPRQQVAEALQSRWSASPAQAELLAHLSGGRLGWAIEALRDETILERRQAGLDDLFELLGMNRAERLAYAQQVGREPAAIKETLSLWLTVWRDLLLLRSGSRSHILNVDRQTTLEALVSRGSVGQAKAVVERLRTALLNFDHNVNTRLNLELVLLKLPKY